MFYFLMNRFLLLLSSVICKLRAQRAGFSHGQICVSQALRSLVILVHCFLRPVNLSPLSKSLLSMHTQPSRLSLLVQSQGHTSVMSLFILYFFFFFSLLVMLRISLFTGKCVLFFKFQLYPSKIFFFFFFDSSFS